MNWYKKAQKRQEEWKWSRFLAGFSIPVILGFGTMFGLSLDQIKQEYAENPQKVEQMISQYQHKNQQTSIIEEQKAPIQEAPIQEPPKEEKKILSKYPDAQIDLDRIWKIESDRGKDPEAFEPNRDGALGHFQFLKGTWDECVGNMDVDWDWRTDAVDYFKSLQVADFYMNRRIPQMIKYFNLPDTVKTRLTAYDWGIVNLKNVIEKYGDEWEYHLPQETKDYFVKYEL